MAAFQEQSANAIEVRGLGTCFAGKYWVHDGLDFTIAHKEIVAIVGGSGTGKTTLLREILMLTRPSQGQVKVLGTDVWHCTAEEAAHLRSLWGVLFQRGALFSSLTVLENILFPLQTHTQLDYDSMVGIARLKIALVGLAQDTADKFPSELSGGMVKRVGIARALAMDPQLLFLDEPSAGLDPTSAHALDELILQLTKTLGLTVVMVTHDLDTLWRVADRVIFLGHGKVLAYDTMTGLMDCKQPDVWEYFHGARARNAAATAHKT